MLITNNDKYFWYRFENVFLVERYDRNVVILHRKRQSAAGSAWTIIRHVESQNYGVRRKPADRRVWPVWISEQPVDRRL